MTLSQGMSTWFGWANDYVLHLVNNIYGQKQAGLVWNSHILDKLGRIGFQPLKSDECVFVHSKCVFVLYVDDGIFLSPDKNLIDKAIKDLIAVGLKIEGQGYPSNYIGVNIKKNEKGSIKLPQQASIQSIIKDIKLGPRASLNLCQHLLQ